MSALSFSFENNPITVVLKDGEPWFVASEVTKVLKLSNPTVSLRTLRDVERAKIIIKGRETNVVRESGLYTLILRSQDAIKEGTAAFRFRVKVTDEILPAIRKTGRYECPAQPQYLTDQQCWAIQSAVGKRAKGVGAHFQTIYRALKARFQVPTYTRILSKDFDEAIAFIRELELPALPAPETAAAPAHAKQPAGNVLQDGSTCPCCGGTLIPENSAVLSSREAWMLVGFIYMNKYLFRDIYVSIYRHLRSVQSPLASRWYDFIHEIQFGMIERILAEQGFDVKQLKSYQAWRAKNPQ